MVLQKEDGVYYAEQFLNFYDCDCYMRLKLSSVMKYIADVAGVDYTLKGYDHEYLWNNGMVFLLSRTNIAVQRMPMAYETITLSTWEQGKKGSQFLRHFELFDEKGEKIISAATAWLLVNPQTRKILRPEVFTGFMPIRGDKLPDCAMPGKLRMPDGGSPAGTRKIRYSDLDGNGHVYNAVYGDIACDVLPAEVLKRPLRSFQINYQTEAVLGEDVELCVAADPDASDTFYIEGRNAAGGNCFICKYAVI